VADLAGLVAAFSTSLRQAGIPVTSERAGRFADAVLIAGPVSVPELFHLGRATLLTGREQYETYERVFDRVFRGILGSPRMQPETLRSAGASGASTGQDTPAPNAAQQGAASPPPGTGADPSSRGDDDDSDDDGDDEQSPVSVLAAMSSTERLLERSFADLQDEELLLIKDLIAALPLAAPLRRGMRLRRAPRGHSVDVRASLRRAHRTGGDPIRLLPRRRRPRPRRIVLIADVSGSMAPYARAYLHLLRGAVVSVRAEAFVFSTQLTRLTRTLAATNADAAYRKVADAAPDWSSGTRIGRALLQFIDDHGRRGLARGSVIVIVSDGWEVEDPALVALAMQRLQRLAHRIIWVNPRKASADYAPLVGGMAAALPHVDTFLSGHSVQALGDVVRAIAGASPSVRSRPQRSLARAAPTA